MPHKLDPQEVSNARKAMFFFLQNCLTKLIQMREIFHCRYIHCRSSCLILVAHVHMSWITCFCVGSGNITAVLHMLELLKSVISEFPKSALKSTCELILGLLGMHNMVGVYFVSCWCSLTYFQTSICVCFCFWMHFLICWYLLLWLILLCSGCLLLSSCWPELQWKQYTECLLQSQNQRVFLSSSMFR